MDLELLKRFYIVAQEGTLAKASERIHVVPSALTKSISDFGSLNKENINDIFFVFFIISLNANSFKKISWYQILIYILFNIIIK